MKHYYCITNLKCCRFLVLIVLSNPIRHNHKVPIYLAQNTKDTQYTVIDNTVQSIFLQNQLSKTHLVPVTLERVRFSPHSHQISIVCVFDINKKTSVNYSQFLLFSRQVLNLVGSYMCSSPVTSSALNFARYLLLAIPMVDSSNNEWIRELALFPQQQLVFENQRRCFDQKKQVNA